MNSIRKSILRLTNHFTMDGSNVENSEPPVNTTCEKAADITNPIAEEVFATTPVKDTTNVLNDICDQSNSDEEQFLECASSFINTANTNLENSLPAKNDHIDKFKNIVFSTPKINKDDNFNQVTNDTFETLDNTAQSKTANESDAKLIDDINEDLKNCSPIKAENNTLNFSENLQSNDINVTMNVVPDQNVNSVEHMHIDKSLNVVDEGMNDTFKTSNSIQSEVVNITFDTSKNVEATEDTLNELNMTLNKNDALETCNTEDSLVNDLEKLKIDNQHDTFDTELESQSHELDNVEMQENCNKTFETLNNLDGISDAFNNTFQTINNIQCETAAKINELQGAYNEKETIKNTVPDNFESKSIKEVASINESDTHNITFDASNNIGNIATSKIIQSTKDLGIVESENKKINETFDNFKENSANELNSIKNPSAKSNNNIDGTLKSIAELNLPNKNNNIYQNEQIENTNNKQPEEFDMIDKNLKNEKNSFLIESELQDLNKAEKTNHDDHPEFDNDFFNNPFKKPTFPTSSQNKFSSHFPDSEFTQGNNDFDFATFDLDYLDQFGNKKTSTIDDRRDSVLLKFDPLLKKPAVAAPTSFLSDIPEFTKCMPKTEVENIETATNFESINQTKDIIKEEFILEESSFDSTKSEKISSFSLEKFDDVEMNVDTIKDKVENKEIEENNFENRELQMRLKAEDYEKKIHDAEMREEALLKRITEKDKTIAKMSGVVEAYEKAIAELIAEKEQLQQESEKHCAELKHDSEINAQHLASLETTFSDIHAKYERTKQIAAELKEREEALLQEKKVNAENLRMQEIRYEKMKSHAMSQLEIANNKLAEMTKNHTAEMTKLKAMLKKEEISRASITEQLLQKSKENEELVKICDELINGSQPSN